MKIAYLANVRFPSERAHSSQIGHMCQAFVNNGLEVDLFVCKRVVESKEQTDNSLGFISNFNIIRIRSIFLSVGIKSFFYLGELIFALNFALNFNIKKYDFIYSRSEWILFFLSYFLPSKKLVWESHEARLSLPARYLLKNCVKTVVISNGIFDTYRENGVKKSQLHLAYDGIDESFFEELESREVVRKRLDITESKRIVMYIGGFDEWKGIDTFCASAKKNPEVSFIVIGGSVQQVENYSEQYPEVRFLGQLPYSNLRNNQQAADILVIPNTAKIDLSLKYTSPLKLFAHMASGIPIIASDIPSITTVIGNDVATLFTPDDVESLSNCIKKLFDNYSLFQSKAKQLKIISNKYTWTKRAEDIINFIK